MSKVMRKPLWEEVIAGDAMENLPTPEPLIDGVLYLESTALIYGSPGVGKSFVALDWALSVATGNDWDGHTVQHLPVLYVIGEGFGGMASRYVAWKRYHEVTSIPDMYFAPRAVDLQTQQGKEELYRAVDRTNASLVVLDTLARHIPGGDENSFATVSHLVEVMDEIRRATYGCVLGVHHPGKNAENGARGHSSLKGALDTEILCVKGPTLQVTKQKDHADGHSLGSYQLLPVGESMVVAPRDSRPPGVNDELALACLNSEAISHGEWKVAAIAYGVPEGSFARARLRLVESGQVIQEADTATGETRYHLK